MTLIPFFMEDNFFKEIVFNACTMLLNFFYCYYFHQYIALRAYSILSGIF